MKYPFTHIKRSFLTKEILKNAQYRNVYLNFHYFVLILINFIINTDKILYKTILIKKITIKK